MSSFQLFFFSIINYYSLNVIIWAMVKLSSFISITQFGLNTIDCELQLREAGLIGVEKQFVFRRYYTWHIVQ